MTLPAAGPSPTRTVLIVDDDPNVTETFERMLTLEGYRVVTALNVEEGLTKAHQARPGAIILDLRMPLANGVEFLRRLRARENPARTPVAIVTGDYFLDDHVSSEIHSLGAEVRFKPLWMEDLLTLARQLLKS